MDELKEGPGSEAALLGNKEAMLLLLLYFYQVNNKVARNRKIGIRIKFNTPV